MSTRGWLIRFKFFINRYEGMMPPDENATSIQEEAAL